MPSEEKNLSLKAHIIQGCVIEAAQSQAAGLKLLTNTLFPVFPCSHSLEFSDPLIKIYQSFPF